MGNGAPGHAFFFFFFFFFFFEGNSKQARKFISCNNFTV